MDSSRARESRCHSKARTCATGLRLRSLSNYVHLVDTKFTKWSNFVREAWLIKEKWNKPSCLKPPMNADARRCSAPLTGVNRRASAVPYPRRYEVCSLRLAMLPEKRLFEEKCGAAFDAFAKHLQQNLAAPGTCG